MKVPYEDVELLRAVENLEVFALRWVEHSLLEKLLLVVSHLFYALVAGVVGGVFLVLSLVIEHVVKCRAVLAEPIGSNGLVSS